ncbi:MAG: M28 family peptidase [Gemmatimonadaceae bacterium]
MLTSAQSTVLSSISLDAPWGLIERFTTLRREHPDDVRTAAEEIVARLRQHGVPVEVHNPVIYLSLPGKASIAAGGATYRAKPMAMSVPYPAGLTAPLAYVPARYARNADEMFTKGFVSDAEVDVAGKIVVSEGFGMPGKVSYFEQRGALGMIAVNPGKHPHWGDLHDGVGHGPDLRDLPRKPRIAVVAVNNPDGQALISLAREGREVTLTSDGTEGWFASPVPVVTIPGTDEPDAFVLLHGHYDSWDFGIGDNAVGDATLLEVTRVLWKHRDQLKRSVRIAWWPGHSTGRYAGSTWFADRFAIDLYENCIAQVNCDSPGCRWATEYIDVSLMEETEAYCASIIQDIAGKALRGERPHQAGDYSFNNIGISSFFMLLSTMPHELRDKLGYYAVGGCGANIEWHTEEDLIHIADKDVLLTDMKIYCAAVMGVANETIAPFDFSATLDDFERTLSAYQEASGAAFDFGASRDAIRELKAALRDFGEFAHDLAGQPVTHPAVRRANQALRRLARLLVPVNFTRGPEFFHDPAETTPALPDLAAALQVPTAGESLGFVQTHLTRGQNRLVAALRDARRVSRRPWREARRGSPQCHDADGKHSMRRVRRLECMVLPGGAPRTRSTSSRTDAPSRRESAPSSAPHWSPQWAPAAANPRHTRMHSACP